MDPFRLCIAIGPLAVYCLILGLINLRRRPFMTTGASDLAAIGAAVTGLVVVGPMDLFMPEAAAVRFGVYVWLMLLAFYGLSVSLAVLLSRPRLVIYNISADELRPILADLVPTLDSQARWAGDSLALPELGIQFHLECFSMMRNISLVAGGERQSFEGWRKFEAALNEHLREAQVAFNPRGVSQLGFAMMMIIAVLIQCIGDPQALAQGMREMLRF